MVGLRGGLYGYLGAVLTVTLSLAFIYICLRQLGLWLTRRYCTHIPRVSSPQLQSRLCNTGKGISSRLGRLASARLITLPSLPQINNLLTFFYLLNPALLLVLLLPIALMLLLTRAHSITPPIGLLCGFVLRSSPSCQSGLYSGCGGKPVQCARHCTR